MNDIEYMKQALELAENGMGLVNPNPMVGAVVVKDGRIISKGWHERFGGLHAERAALENCTEDCSGADLYVTLEPCCHYGKTPPCTDIIIEKKIKRVFIGSSDPNPLVAGQGAAKLREAGIEVIEGVLKEECDALNEIFFHFITTGLPFVTMKYAMTLDGKIACYTGHSKWITGEAARANVQRDRLRHSAVMVGVGTVFADDPTLTCKLENGRDPVRIICDTHLRTPLSSKIVATAKDVPTIIAAHSENAEKIAKFESFGCNVLQVDEFNGHLSLTDLMKSLGEEGIDSILLEGGSELNWSALKAGIVNKVQAYIAPKLFGGETSRTPVSGIGVPFPADAIMLGEPKITRFGDDLLIESRVKPCSQD